MSTWLVFGLIMIAMSYVVYRLIYKKDNGCSACSSCKNRGCHDGLKAYLKQQDRVHKK